MSNAGFGGVIFGKETFLPNQDESRTVEIVFEISK